MAERGFLMHIPIAKPYFDKTEINQLTKTLKSGWVMQGPRVEKFENIFAEYVGVKYAVSASSGTTALHLALLAAGIGLNDEVITTAFSFIATANSVLYCGAYPAFCDIDDKTYNLDPEKIMNFIENNCKKSPARKLVNKRTKRPVRAIMPVDQVGMPNDMDKIKKIAKSYNLSVVEDAACALGAVYKKKMVGAMADASCFSFHPRKIITTAEGGMITTNNQTIAERVKILRSHGRAHGGAYPCKGYNYRMSDLHASLGIGQMEKLNKILSRRRFLAKRYDNGLSGQNMLVLPFVPDYAKPNYQSYMVKVRGGKRLRDALVRSLSKAGISAKPGITAIHEEPCYKKLLGRIRLPITEEANRSTVMLPLYPSLKEKEQDRVIEAVRNTCRKF